MIEVRDLLKRHGGTTVLQELNFNVPERALTAIIGPNGAGKSTLLSLVSRLMPITEGQVLVAGRDVAPRPPRRWRASWPSCARTTRARCV